jgi:lipoprotein-releasing system permease protein
MPLEWFIALRFLRQGRMQSVLIIAGVGVGVGVLVFLSALITGLQQSLIEQTLGVQPHIVVRPEEEKARELIGTHTPGGPLVAARVEKPAQRIRSIDGWQHVRRAIDSTPGVLATSPMAAGSAFAVRGNANKSVALMGVDAADYARIIDVPGHMVAGRYSLSGTEAVIGRELAEDLGLGVGDKLRVQTAEGRSELFTVRGVFDLGNRDVNRRWVLVSLRSAQTLLDLVGGVSNIEIKVARIFDADAIAQRIAARTGLVSDSWMKTNAQLLTALRSQSSSSSMIQVFVIVAVAMGIASVLIVSVVQKSREIGILRAMGTPRARVLRVFLIEGALVGLSGSIMGGVLGSGLALFFQQLAVAPDGSPLFPVALTATLLGRSALIATLTGIVAAALPARRAARLDPAVAIRYE